MGSFPHRTYKVGDKMHKATESPNHPMKGFKYISAATLRTKQQLNKKVTKGGSRQAFNFTCLSLHTSPPSIHWDSFTKKWTLLSSLLFLFCFALTLCRRCTHKWLLPNSSLQKTVPHPGTPAIKHCATACLVCYCYLCNCCSSTCNKCTCMSGKTPALWSTVANS